MAAVSLAHEERHRNEAVWSSLDIYDARNEKVAVTIAAIARLLDARKPLNGGETGFLSVYEQLHDLKSQAFTRLVQAPETYCWAHHAYDLIHAFCRAEKSYERPATESIAELLEEFKRLALGAFIAEERDICFASPYQGTLPINLPCTNLLLYGAGPAEIRGVVNGCVEVTVGGKTFHLSTDPNSNETVPPVSLLRQPAILLNGREIILSPYVFSPSRVDSPDRENTLQVGLQGHREYLPLMEETFKVMQRFAPGAYEQIVAAVYYIGLNDPERSDRSQTSLSDMPGSFIVPCYVNPFANIEVIIHEYFHNRLFALEEIGRIFTDEDDEKALGKLKLFSPWRVAARPIKGLLHSIYVFIPVTRFWLTVFESTNDSDPVKAYALDDSIRQILNLRIGMHLLLKHGKFTDHGQTIIDSMKSRVEEIIDHGRRIGIPHDATAMVNNLDGSIGPLRWIGHDQPVSVRENLRANIEKNDINGDCRDLPFEI